MTILHNLFAGVDGQVERDHQKVVGKGSRNDYLGEFIEQEMGLMT